MKHLLSSLAFCISAVSAIAQPSLNASTSNPIFGDVYTYYQGTTAISPGSAGANANWDFSSATSSSNYDFAYNSCASDPSCSSFAGTTIVGVQGANTSKGYLIENANLQATKGLVAGGVNFTYTNTEETLHFPFTFNSTFTDTWAATFTSGVTFYRSGNITVTGDAYGTLKTPVGTYPNSLRVHRVEVYKDSSASIPIINYTSDIYAWYSTTASREFLFSISSLTTPQGSNTYTLYSKMKASSVDDVYSVAATMRCFPNPATDKLSIAFTTEETADIRISLMDMTGREVGVVANRSFYPGDQKIDYSLTNLPPGIYAVNMSINGEKTIAKKIQVL